MKKIIGIILIVLSIASIILVYNDDFLYNKKIIKVEKIETVQEEVLQNDLGLKEKYYTKEITGIVTNGKDKGKKEKVTTEETYSSVVTDKYRVNDKLIISGSDIELKRDIYVVIMFVLFMDLIYFIGSFKGLLSILSVAVNSIIFYIGLLLYFKGVNLLFLCIIETVLFAVLSLILASGVNKKTLSAILSVITSTVIITILLLITVKLTNYKGINFNEISFLTVPLEDVILPELLIGSVGAIMDVAITISSSIAELIEKDKKITTKRLNKSAKEIGKDIMSTMSNVLFFTYLCAGLPIFVLALRNGFTMYNYITTNFSLELSRFLVGSIGIVLTIPISAFISIKLMKRGAR